MYFYFHIKTAGIPDDTDIPAVLFFNESDTIIFTGLDDHIDSSCSGSLYVHIIVSLQGSFFIVVYNEHESGRVNDKTVCVLCNVFKRSVIHDNSVPFIL